MKYLVTFKSLISRPGNICFAVLVLLLTLAETGTLPGQQPVTFALLTDLHVNPGSSSDTSLNLMVEEINKTNIDFVVVTGDISNSGSDPELLAVKKALDKLNKPCYTLPGNHETNWSESAGLLFNKLWGNDRFFFRKNGYVFIGFNTGPFMKMGDGHVKQEDLLWLKRELQTNNLKNEVLISFSHYPLADGLDDWFDVTGILKSFGCRIDFCGHGHRLALFNFDGITGIMGRSALAGNSKLPGYNLVQLRHDSVFVFNKELSKSKGKPVIALNYLKPDTLSKIAVSPKPDFSVNKIYTNRNVIGELSDTSSIFSGPCMVNDTVLVYGNSLGYIKAINIKSMRILWQVKTKGPVYSTPVASGGIVVLGTVEGSIIGLNSLNGKQLWAANTGRPVLSEGIIEDGSIYIGGGDRSFYKINIKTGGIIWLYTGVEGLIQGKPAISGSGVVFGAWDRYLYCLDKNSGALKWKWDNGKPQKLYSPGNIFPVCSGNRVFIVAPDRYMTSINLSDGKEIWRTNIHQVRESIGISPDGALIYAKLMNDTIIAVSAKEDYPKTVWTVNGGFGYEHNPCPLTATADMVIAGTRDGVLVAVDPQAKQVMWKYKAGNSSVNKIVAGKNRTFWFTLAEGKIIGIKTIDS
jgi:outer membrane protein assembly factor BamB